MNRRVVAMLRTIIGRVSWFLGLLTVGCAGLGVPQQPRFEIPEPVVRMIVRPQGPFFSPSRLTVAKSPDGTLSVRSLPGDGEKWTRKIPPPDAALSELHDALLPFLVPACEARLR